MNIMKEKKDNIDLKYIIDSVIKEHSLRQGFPKSLSFCIEKIRKKKSTLHKNFKDIPFVTIDGEDSKDFDDAVWSENKNNKTKIMVAVADVSFYIQKNDLLDIEAKKRGNSFYFPDRVIPMLPTEISNDICSLVPNEERLCVVIEIELTNNLVTNFDIHRAKIRSVGRLTYNQVDQVYYSKDTDNKYFKLISNLFESYKILNIKSKQRNKINFETDEFEIISKFDNEFAFKKKKRLESYRLIEEFMILANENVAKFLKNNKLNSIFRNHGRPSEEKICELKKILSDNNIYKKEKFNTQKDFNRIMKKLNENNFFIYDALLRSQSKAYYFDRNEGHFGLSLDYYTHFTSPIRRYSDLQVHRDLTNFLFYKKRNKLEVSLSEHLTSQEKKSDYIERKIIERACSLYIKKTKQKFFTGVVDGIESFGIFIKAYELPFSCLARIKPRNHSYNKGFSIKPNFQIGQRVSFKIKRNDIRSGKILVERVKEMKNI